MRMVPHMVPNIIAPDQEQDSARSRSDPSDQRTLSCRIGTLLGSSVWSKGRADLTAQSRVERRRPARHRGQCLLDRRSVPTNPVPWAAFQVHDRENAQLAPSNRVEQCIRKPLTQPAPDCARYNRTGLWIFGHRNGASLYFCDEGGAKPRLLVLVVLRRVIEFALGQLVERDAHSLDPGPRLSKDFVCLAA